MTFGIRYELLPENIPFLIPYNQGLRNYKFCFGVFHQTKEFIDILIQNIFAPSSSYEVFIYVNKTQNKKLLAK
jgi:hypothetical protein